jgi:hypothetical protein
VVRYSSLNLLLNITQRTNAQRKYFEKEKVDEVIDVSEEHDFFPLLCALYQKDNRVDIKSFFEKPFNFYTAEIDYLSASDCEICDVCSSVVFRLPQKSIADKITLRMFNNKFRHFPPKIIGQKIV